MEIMVFDNYDLTNMHIRYTSSNPGGQLTNAHQSWSLFETYPTLSPSDITLVAPC